MKVSTWKVSLLSARCLNKEDPQQGRFQIMCKQQRVSRWASRENWENCHPPYQTTAAVTIQPPKDTAWPINLPHYHCYRPSVPKDRTRWETGWGSGWGVGVVLMGGSAVGGRNKSEEWKIRKRNLSHHCRLPLSPPSCCKRSMESRGEARLACQPSCGIFLNETHSFMKWDRVSFQYAALDAGR